MSNELDPLVELAFYPLNLSTYINECILFNLLE